MCCQIDWNKYSNDFIAVELSWLLAVMLNEFKKIFIDALFSVDLDGCPWSVNLIDDLRLMMTT